MQKYGLYTTEPSRRFVLIPIEARRIAKISLLTQVYGILKLSI